jgi:hypothetical protein
VRLLAHLEAAVDEAAPVHADLRGVKTKTALFTMRPSYSGRAAHKSFLTQGQEAFLEGHVCAPERLGGVRVDKIRYDNLNSAVRQVLFGRSREEKSIFCPGGGAPSARGWQRSFGPEKLDAT